MELFMREEICEKKKKIYNQQKHYTKKTMYADDKGQAISKSKRYQPSTMLVVVCSVLHYFYRNVQCMLLKDFNSYVQYTNNLYVNVCIHFKNVHNMYVVCMYSMLK